MKNSANPIHFALLAACLFTVPFISAAADTAAIPTPTQKNSMPMNAMEMIARKQAAKQAQMQEFHDALKLTKEQEADWKIFIESSRSTKPINKIDPQKMDKLTAPERADQMLEMEKEREKMMEQRVAALKIFYAKLTPEQQKIFDTYHSEQNPMKMHPMKPGAMPDIK